MPEPTPTTDVVSELKPGGKQFPKWGYFAIGGAVVIALLIYKSKKSKEEAVFQPAETGGQNLEEELPISGGGGLGAANQLQKQNTEFLEHYLGIEAEPKPKAGELGNQPGRNGNGSTETKVHHPQEEPFKRHEPTTTPPEKGPKLPKKQNEGVGEKPVVPETPKAPIFPTKKGNTKPPPKTKGKPPKLQPVGGNKPLP